MSLKKTQHVYKKDKTVVETWCCCLHWLWQERMMTNKNYSELIHSKTNKLINIEKQVVLKMDILLSWKKKKKYFSLWWRFMKFSSLFQKPIGKACKNIAEIKLLFAIMYKVYPPKNNIWPLNDDTHYVSKIYNKMFQTYFQEMQTSF